MEAIEKTIKKINKKTNKWKTKMFSDAISQLKVQVDRVKKLASTLKE